MPARRLGVALVLVLVAAGPGRAAAQAQDEGGLERARTQLGELRYDDALATLGKTLEAGTSGPATTAQLYLLLGEVRASLDHAAAAEKAFRLALAIDPGLELRAGLSPKINRPFRRARKALRGAKPLAIAHRIVGQNPVVIAVIVQSDPMGVVVGARIAYRRADGAELSVAGGGAAGKTPPGDGARFDLELPRGVTRFTIAGVDQHGNRVVELGSPDAPLSLDIDSGGARPAADEPAPASAQAVAASPRADASVESRSERPPIYASWILWGGVAVAVGAAGTWAGISAQSAVDELDDIRGTEYEVEFSKAKRVADRAEQRSLVANICFAGAGASAIVSGILFFRARRHRADESAALAPMIGPDQVGVSASLRF